MTLMHSNSGIKHRCQRRVFKATLVFAIFFMVTLQLIAGQAEAEEALIEVGEFAWTNGVKEHQPLEKYSGETSSRPLYLWMRIEGKVQALERLKEQGKLPISHQWYQVIGGRQHWYRGQELKDEVEFSVGMNEKIDKLELELTNRSFFDWRIWSMKESPPPGWWIVRMVYADNKPVQCGTTDCEWSIEVK